MNPQEIKAALARVFGENRELKRQVVETLAEYKALRKAYESAPKSITQVIDAIPGRRIFYNLSGTQVFNASMRGQRGQPVSFLLSQDGPYVMTHYPMVVWRPSAPENADRFGRWRPPSSWPLPTQEIAGDSIDLSYEFVSGGAQRNFNNEPAGPIFSRPDNLVPLPVPTMFTPADVIQMVVTYQAINFAATDVPTTEGTLQITLPGYRIVNL